MYDVVNVDWSIFELPKYVSALHVKYPNNFQTKSLMCDSDTYYIDSNKQLWKYMRRLNATFYSTPYNSSEFVSANNEGYVKVCAAYTVRMYAILTNDIQNIQNLDDYWFEVKLKFDKNGIAKSIEYLKIPSEFIEEELLEVFNEKKL